MSAPAQVVNERKYEWRSNLEKANQVRVERSKLKDEIRAGRDVVPLLAEPPRCLLSAKVRDVLLLMPRHGRYRVDNLMRRLRVRYNVTVGTLSTRERAELLLALGETNSG